VRVFLRILLIFVALFLLFRYLLAVIFPSRRETGVKGSPRRRGKRIDDERIQDASFKDLPKK